jgi:hypothetical protein
MFIDSKIRLALNNALLKKITNNLRKVLVDLVGTTSFIYFFYEGEITSLDEMLAKEAIDQLQVEHPCNASGNKITYIYKIQRLDYPTKPPDLGNTAYLRYEPTPIEFRDE